jgi:hypothetical protein
MDGDPSGDGSREGATVVSTAPGAPLSPSPAVRAEPAEGRARDGWSFTHALYDQAKKNGWVVTSVKDEWERMFSLEPRVGANQSPTVFRLPPGLKIAGKTFSPLKFMYDTMLQQQESLEAALRAEIAANQVKIEQHRQLADRSRAGRSGGV